MNEQKKVFFFPVKMKRKKEKRVNLYFKIMRWKKVSSGRETLRSQGKIDKLSGFYRDEFHKADKLGRRCQVQVFFLLRLLKY